MSAQEDGFTARLSDDEARARLLRDGPNRLPQDRRRSLAGIALDAATQPMILLLLATTLAYAALGSATDGIGLMLSVLLIGVIAVYQQQRTERVLESLRELSSPRSRVMRSGHVQRIASQDLVRGDLLRLAGGDRLACDAVILRCHSLLLDESLLTGDSAPVLEHAASNPALAATDAQRVRAGTLVVQGDGAARVDATGAHTALGRIGSSLAQIVPRASRVQAELKRVVSGVAMGQRGNDVAREAAALVLLDDSFASLVAAVRMGRRNFLNPKKSVGYLLAVHVPIVGVALIPVLLGGPQLLLPLHVVFLELPIDPA